MDHSDDLSLNGTSYQYSKFGKLGLNSRGRTAGRDKRKVSFLSRSRILILRKFRRICHRQKLVRWDCRGHNLRFNALLTSCRQMSKKKKHRGGVQTSRVESVDRNYWMTDPAKMPVLISITRFAEGNMGKHRKNTVAKLGRHLVNCPLPTGVKLCEKVVRKSMMESRE